MNKRISEKYVKKIDSLINNDDVEYAHVKADNILVDFIRELGYVELADKYESIPKWYS